MDNSSINPENLQKLIDIGISLSKEKNIDSLKVVKEGKVRRAKLYYLRSRKGKAARVKEKVSFN